MRILQIVYGFEPHRYRGGIPKVVVELSQALHRLGHEVYIASTTTDGLRFVHPSATIDLEGVEVRYFPVDYARWVLSYGLYKKVTEIAPTFDVIHSHNTFLALNLVARIASRSAHTPLFFQPHGSLDPLVINGDRLKTLRKKLYISLIERYNYDAATGIIALSLAEAGQLMSLGVKRPIHVIPNAVTEFIAPSPSEIAKFRDRFGIASTAKAVLYIGRFVPKKGVHLLIAAFQQVLLEYPEAILILGGPTNSDSKYEQELRRQIANFGIEASVRWTGHLDEKDKRAAWACASLFSHVSTSEGMPMSVLESMAAGLPTIISPGCNLPAAQEANAAVVCPFSSDELYTRLCLLLSDETMRSEVGGAGREYVQNRHSWQATASEFVKVYAC